MLNDLLPTLSTYIFRVKIQLFVTTRFKWDPDLHGLAPWIRIRIEIKRWIRIRIEISVDPVFTAHIDLHCNQCCGSGILCFFFYLRIRIRDGNIRIRDEHPRSCI
jgi:hypothetical protein